VRNLVAFWCICGFCGVTTWGSQVQSWVSAGIQSRICRRDGGYYGRDNPRGRGRGRHGGHGGFNGGHGRGYYNNQFHGYGGYGRGNYGSHGNPMGHAFGGRHLGARGPHPANQGQQAQSTTGGLPQAGTGAAPAAPASTMELSTSSAVAATAAAVNAGAVLGAPQPSNFGTSTVAGSATTPIGGPAIGGPMEAHGHAGTQPMQGVEPIAGGGLEVGAATQEPETSLQGANKSKNKPYCYRCHTKGHVYAMSTAIISCDICESDAHVTKICPLLKGDKPMAIPWGYAVENLGFYYIPHTGAHKARSESKGALVRVLEGSITAAQLAVELERLIPGSKWEIEEKGKDTFTTTFPSAIELGWCCGVTWKQKL